MYTYFQPLVALHGGGGGHPGGGGHHPGSGGHHPGGGHHLHHGGGGFRSGRGGFGPRFGPGYIDGGGYLYAVEDDIGVSVYIKQNGVWNPVAQNVDAEQARMIAQTWTGKGFEVKIG